MRKLICNDPTIWDILTDEFDITNGIDFEEYVNEKYGSMDTTDWAVYNGQVADWAVHFTYDYSYIYVDDYKMCIR